MRRPRNPSAALSSLNSSSNTGIVVHNLVKSFGPTKVVDRISFEVPNGELVALLGPSGGGKTRLAMEAGRRLMPDFAVSAFVPLADVIEPERILHSLSAALRLPYAFDDDLFAHLRERLTDAPALLILDNLEHLLPEGASLVRRLLQAAPALRCLVTSREALEIEGERPLPIGPLPTPPEVTSSAHLTDYPGAALFLDRAASARSIPQDVPTMPATRAADTNSAASTGPLFLRANFRNR